MKRRSGQIMRLPDGRKVVRFNKQDLLKEHSKVVLHLMNEDFSLQMEGDREKTIIKTVDEYNAMLPGCTAIGMID